MDIDQALSGIDRLLKSQELTFAFVGVAPALAVVYAVVGGLDRLWNITKGSGSWGGKKKRRAVWEGMRFVLETSPLPEPELIHVLGGLKGS